MSRDFHRKVAAYRRNPRGVVSSGHSFLIVTEGLKTEPNYVRLLRNRLQLAAADVEIVHPQGTDPITLTRRAVELRDERKKAARKGSAVEYDEVWVVLDLEEPNGVRRRQAHEAFAMIEATGIKFATSDPCFEYWLLLHEEYTTAQFGGCNAVTTRLMRHWPSYSKGQTPEAHIIEKTPTAVINAGRCRDHHDETGGDGNPSTSIDKLVRALNQATRRHLQMIFN